MKKKASMSDEIKITNQKDALEAIKKDGRLIRKVPLEFITDGLVKICLEHRKKDGYVLEAVLECVPPEYITANMIQMCLDAVKIDHANEKAKSFKNHREGGMPAGNLIKMLNFVPERLVSVELEKMCIEEVKKKDAVFARLPEHFRTAAVSLEAVKKNAKLLKYVPEKARTTEIYLEAVKQDASHFQKVPDELKNEQMCLLAVKNAVSTLQYVPENLKTREICLEAVKKHAGAIEYIGENLKNQEIIEEAKKGGYVTGIHKAAKISTMDDYTKTLTEQIKVLPPQAREAMLQNLAPGMREQILEALG